MASSRSVPVIMILLLLTSTTKARQLEFFFSTFEHISDDTTTNGTFSSNRQSLVHALTSNAATTGFSEGEIGNTPDRVYGVALCRGDIDSTTCQSCLSTASQHVLHRWASARVVAIAYDYCFLRYSNTSFASNVDHRFKFGKCYANNVTSEWPRFKQSLMSLLSQLRRYAAYNTSAPPLRMFATGLIKFNDREYPNITALVQCTRDLTPDRCNQCLTNIIDYQLNWCDHKSGGRAYSNGCNFKYEAGVFSNGTSRISLPAIADWSRLVARSSRFTISSDYHTIDQLQ